MEIKEKKRTTLWYSIVGIGIILALSAYYFFIYQQPPLVNINIDNQPTFGNINSSVKVVVFEEPKCPSCKRFTMNIFPKIKEEFIDTNLISYTLIPVSFIPNSMPIAISWLCMYEHEKKIPNKNIFFTYVNKTYEQFNPELDSQLSESEVEKKMPLCESKEIFKKVIKKNTAYEMKIMQGDIFTPAVYVNGLLVKDLSYENIEKIIKAAMEENYKEMKN